METRRQKSANPMSTRSGPRSHIILLRSSTGKTFFPAEHFVQIAGTNELQPKMPFDAAHRVVVDYNRCSSKGNASTEPPAAV